MGTSFNEALSPQDIATMGALCSLASLSRPELKRQVVDNLGFREYLEAVPEVCPDLNSAGMHSGQVRDAAALRAMTRSIWGIFTGGLRV